MDINRFDHLTRGFAHLITRRAIAGALSLGTLAWPALAESKKKKRKRKKKKVKFNEFGCVNFGKFCKNDDQCCSGICEGKKDKRTCKAHDQSTCQAGQTFSECGGTNVPCTTSSGEAGVCFTTTGNAGFCFASGNCFPCQKDADCIEVCGPSAACVVCLGGECADDGDTACVAPGDEDCDFPPIPISG